MSRLTFLLLAACSGSIEPPETPPASPPGAEGPGGQPGTEGAPPPPGQPGVGGPGQGGPGGQSGVGGPGQGGPGGQPGVGGPGQAGPGQAGPGGSQPLDLTPAGDPTCQDIGEHRIVSGATATAAGVVRIHSKATGDCAWTDEGMLHAAPGTLITAQAPWLVTALGESSPREYAIADLASGAPKTRFAVWTEKTAEPTLDDEALLIPGMLINAGRCLSQQTGGSCAERVSTCWESFQSTPEGVQIEGATLSCPEAESSAGCMIALYADARIKADAPVPVISGEVRCMVLQ